jgi:hypothetical protein
LKRKLRLGIVSFIVGSFMLVSPADANVVCNTYTYTGHDDTAYPANLPFTLKLGLTEYENVYVTTNGTLTFGQPDATFHDYPQTPSVSVAGYDWVTWGEGAYVSFGSTENTLCVEWSIRPFPQSQGELTQIRLVINKYPSGTWHGEVTTFGWLPADLRRGIRYERGEPVVTIAAAFDVGNGGIPIEVEPAPVPSSFEEPPMLPTPSPEPVPSIEPSLDPEPTPIPEPTQNESPSPEPTVEPSPTPVVTPSVTPVADPTPSPSQESVVPVPVVPTPTPEVVQEVVQVEPTPSPSPTIEELVPEITPEPQPTMAVPAPVSHVDEFLAQVSIQLPTYLENVPGAVQLAKAAETIMAIGSDMTPEQREESQGVVVAAIIIGQLAQTRRLK